MEIEAFRKGQQWIGNFSIVYIIYMYYVHGNFVKIIADSLSHSSDDCTQ